MAITKQMNIKNKTYYFYNDLIKLFEFDSNILKLDKKISKGINIYYIGYVTKKVEYKINSVNPLYLLIYKIDGFIEENIAFIDNNDEVLRKYREVLGGIKSCIEKINNNKSGEYEKDYLKIEFNSDDKLPLNKQLAFLDDCLYES